jgi:hypothetical protein
MKALVIYESMYGNTRDVALAIADGLSSIADVEVIEVGTAPDTIPDDIDFVVAGGPTHQFGMSRESSRESARSGSETSIVSTGRGIREWIQAVEFARKETSVATFDTTMGSPWFLRYMGRASGKIARGLRRKGCKLITTPESFWVSGGNGPLVEGELERARIWAGTLAERIPTRESAQVPA